MLIKKTFLLISSCRYELLIDYEKIKKNSKFFMNIKRTYLTIVNCLMRYLKISNCFISVRLRFFLPFPVVLKRSPQSNYQVILIVQNVDQIFHDLHDLVGAVFKYVINARNCVWKLLNNLKKGAILLTKNKLIAN